MNIRHLLIIAAFLLAGILAGCGSGTPATGAANVSLTDGPGDDYDHVWITVKAISFHTNPNQVWSSSDASWQTTMLPAPVTLDLASLTNGALDPVFAGMNLPVGSYKQIRLFLAAYDDPLTASAQSASLTYNDQVDYANSSSVEQHVPLEIAYPVQGIQLLGTFNVATGSTLNLAVDFDLEHDLVRFLHGTQYYFTMKPDLRYFDLDQSGAITGYVDSSALCTSPSNLTGCAYNMIVKAEILSADQSRHVDTRATTVRTDGSFTLYPLPSGASYDVLIRGRNIDTMLVRGVTAPVGSTPASGATVLSTSKAPIPLTIDTEYFANFNSTNPLTPSSGYAIFQQTLPNSGGVTEVPYEVRWGNTNPFTGTLAIPMALATDPIQVASYSAGNALSFTGVTPQQGDGGYSVVTRGLPVAYYDLSSPVTISSPGTNTVSAPLTFAPNNPAMTSNVTAGTVSGNITQTTAGKYDSGYLVISRFANIVDTQDISTTLVANTGTYTEALPAGTASNPVPGAYYYGYLWVWNSAHPLLTLKVVAINGMIDLRNTDSVAGLNVTLP